MGKWTVEKALSERSIYNYTNNVTSYLGLWILIYSLLLKSAHLLSALEKIIAQKSLNQHFYFFIFRVYYILPPNLWHVLHIVPSSSKSSNVSFILYNCIQCVFFDWQCYLIKRKMHVFFTWLIWMRTKWSFHFKNPNCPPLAVVSTIVDFFTDHPSHRHFAIVTLPSSNPTPSLLKRIISMINC